MSTAFNADEVFEMAEQIEQNGARFYREAATKAVSREIKEMTLPERALNNTIMDIQWSPDGRRLAYSRGLSAFSATFELWLTSVGTEESLQLTEGDKKEWSPSWSPDSRARSSN